MVTNALDLPDLAKNWIVDPKSTAMGGPIDYLTSTMPGYHVFGYSSSVYLALRRPHKNAVNVALKDVVTTAANSTDKHILVDIFPRVRRAGQAVMALRLSGFAECSCLNGVWLAGIRHSKDLRSCIEFRCEVQANGNKAVGNANWVKTAAVPANGSYAEPVSTCTSTDGAAITEGTSVQAVLDAGFSPASSDDVLANPSNFQIVNYWSNADYLKYGHFTGAFNVPTIALAGDLIKAFVSFKGRTSILLHRSNIEHRYILAQCSGLQN